MGLDSFLKPAEAFFDFRKPLRQQKSLLIGIGFHSFSSDHDCRGAQHLQMLFKVKFSLRKLLKVIDVIISFA